MHAILQILTGPETGRKIHLKSGQVARFGRTEWSDFAFPYDDLLADVHFSIETTVDAVTMTDLSNGVGVMVDGKKMGTSELRSGQKIKAGNMGFAVTTELQFETSGTGPIAVSNQASAVKPAGEKAIKICKNLELSETAQGLLDDSIEIVPFIDILVGEGLLVDGLRVIAAWLSKRKAVWWAVECVESACAGQIQGQTDLLLATRKWVTEASADNSREVTTIAETADSRLPASWIVRAASWSGNSLLPPGMPSVPPDDQLSTRGILAALLLAASFISPADTQKNYREFIEQGKRLSETKFEWESD